MLEDGTVRETLAGTPQGGVISPLLGNIYLDALDRYCWGLLRAEAGVKERQFLRAMLSHHAAAVQMCNESSLSDPRVLELCRGIISSQEREIAEMKALPGEAIDHSPT